MLDASQISRRIKLRQLNVFIAVVEYGSMAKAAEHLAISQPVISKMIATLEQTLGVPLLERSRVGVEPTLYGNALLKRSIALCNDLRSGVDELQSLADPTMGELRIGQYGTRDGRFPADHRRPAFPAISAARASYYRGRAAGAAGPPSA